MEDHGRAHKKQGFTAHNASARSAIHILRSLHNGLLKDSAVRRQPRGLRLDDPVIGRRLHAHPQCQSCIRAIDAHTERQDTQGVARNILDPATHLLFSNKLEDNAPIDELRAQGLSIDAAITELLRRRGHTV